jgi:predicted glycosyltransferase
MDYEHQPANHVAFRFSNKIIVPECFPSKQLKKYGAHIGKVRRYHGTKEDVYLADFQPSAFDASLSQLGITSRDILVLMRPAARNALYHRFENDLFDEMLAKVLNTPHAKVILLPRDDVQRRDYKNRYSNLIIPEAPLPGADLIAASDLVISAGGTINREAAALGVPAASIYAGEWGAVDQMLIEEGRLMRIRSVKDAQSLDVRKKPAANARRAVAVKGEVVKLILE